MSSIQKLHLEDSLEDTPQTRSMLSVFEKDALMLKKFSKALSSSCQKVLNAQVMMISASQELSYYLRLYGQQDFPLESVESKNEENSLASTLNQFANYVDEISTCFQVLVTQLNDAMIYPLNRQIDQMFDELNSLSQMYQITSEEEDQAVQRYLRLPLRKENESQRVQLKDECQMYKKKFHQTSMSYYSFLNSLQHKRQYMLVEPMLSFMQGMNMMFKMGSDTFSNESHTGLNEFLTKTSTLVCDTKAALSEEINKTNQMIELLQNDESSQNAENENNIQINENVYQKCGYLNVRSKLPFIAKWDREYFFIQNGHLMHQQKNEIAGYSFMELKSDLTVSTCEIDERQFTFQIASQFPKRILRVTYFQANNKRDCVELNTENHAKWIKILQNAINEDNRAKISSFLNTNLSRTSAKSDEEALVSSLLLNNKPKLSHEPNVSFELTNVRPQNKSFKMIKPEQGENFKVRFLGSVHVRADRGNEYINEAIRQIMAARANQNIFKSSEFELIVNSESISLFSPLSGIEKKDEVVSSDELLKARFDLENLAFWSPHRENQRLFGFIVKESNQSLKFICHVFESDVDSTLICESINKATQDAFKLLVEENKVDHFKRMKSVEKEILLQNIRSLPDKASATEGKNEEENDLLNAVINSPNPNFVVLNKETLNLTLNQQQNTESAEKSKDSTNESEA